MLLLAILITTLVRTLASPVPRSVADDSAPSVIDNFISTLSNAFHPIIYGFPLPTATVVHGSAVVSGSGADGQCVQSLRPRTPLTIIWNCFATIAACTFFAMHPNVPSSTRRLYKKLWRRLLITLDALLRPEAVIFWAMRQFIVAIRIRDKYKGAKWTLSHGFFVQMGGLVLVDEENKNREKVVTMDGNGMVYVGKSGVPSPAKIEPDHSIRVFQHGAKVHAEPHRPMDLDFVIPCITYNELQDKAKGDFLSKVASRGGRGSWR
ncbi:hypothetical protein AX16_008442 [Volvariella volvacea WC 439]|nr:hypothetical protein AX16_008442 [Volvariella volvacea WC 439]